MYSILCKLFGNVGIVKFKGISIDDREFVGSIKIESFLMSESDLVDKLKEILYFEKNIKSKTLQITNFCSL